MKNYKNILIYSIGLIFLIGNANATKLSDYIKVVDNGAKSGSSSVASTSIDKALNNALKSVQNEIIEKLDKEIKKVEDMLNKNLNNLTSKFDAEIKKASDTINNDILGKAKKMVDDAEKQYNSIISAKDTAMATVMKIIKNIPTYLMIVKLVVFAIIGLFGAMVFFFWRSYRNTKKLANALLNMDLVKRIDELEAKINKLVK